MSTTNGKSLSRYADKPRIVVDLPHLPEVHEELQKIAEDLGWIIFDIKLNWQVLPENFPVSGAILSPDNDWSKQALKEGRFSCPTVHAQFGGATINTPYPKVITDEFAAGQMAVDSLCDAGFKDILLVIQNDWKDVSQINRGAKEGIEERGCKLHVFRFNTFNGEPTEDRRHRYARELNECILNLPRPLAYVAVNDHIAAQFCFFCESMGLSVPEDVSVIGNGNDEFVCKESLVPLSSVDLDRPGVIREATHLLKRMMAGELPPEEPIAIPPKGIVSRRSSSLLAVADPRVARAVRFMWDHLDWPLTVEDVAAEVNVSRRTLDRAFLKHLGWGINAELRRKRVERCAELLRTTEMSFIDIFKTVGFSSRSYAHKIFRERYGMTPTEYREVTV